MSEPGAPKSTLINPIFEKEDKESVRFVEATEIILARL